MTSHDKRISGAFSRISERYDRINNLSTLGLHKLWKRRVVKIIAERGCGSVLEMCCGTGEIMSLVAEKTGADRVVGVDLSMGMLSVAARRCKGLDNVELICSDVLTQPLEDGSFDCVVISFGLRNLSDPKLALRRARRLLRPGGLFICLDAARPETSAHKSLYRLHYKTLLSLAAGESRPDYELLRRATMGFFTKSELARELRVIGFETPRYDSLFFGFAAIYTGFAPG